MFFRSPISNQTIIMGNGINAGVLQLSPSIPATPSTNWTLAQLIPDSNHRVKRNSMVYDHFGTVHEGNFKGFTTGELASFTTVIVGTADSMISTISGMAASDKKIIECAWNGKSVSGARALCIPSSALTADSAVDYGFVRPAWAVKVKPSLGYAPEVKVTYNSGEFNFTGASKMHFDNMIFDSCGFRLDHTSFYPTYAMLAITNCTFNNSGISTSYPSIKAGSVRTLHVEGNKFKETRLGITGAPNYLRSWNNEFYHHKDDDIHGIRGYTKPAMKLWTGHIWVAGNVVYNTSAANAGSGNHCDFLQIATITESGGTHLGYSVLAELNMANVNRPKGAIETQGMFGGGGSGFYGDHMAHNNLLFLTAKWAHLVYDPTDNQDKVSVKNMFLRSSKNIAGYDAWPVMKGDKVGPLGTGTLQIKNNYAAEFTTGLVSGESYTGNVILDPRTSATTSTKYANVLTGNGTWATDSGRLSYTSPDSGINTADSAFTLIRNFATPLSGWAVDAGPQDPNRWPRMNFDSLT